MPTDDRYSFFDNVLYDVVYKNGYFADKVASKWENPRYVRSWTESKNYLAEFYSKIDTSQKTAAEIQKDVESLKK